MEVIVRDGVKFNLDTRAGAERGVSKGKTFVLVKTERQLAFYDTLRDKAPKEILEIGMLEGGSMVYFDKLFKPKTLVGVDIRRPRSSRWKIIRKPA